MSVARPRTNGSEAFPSDSHLPNAGKQRMNVMDPSYSEEAVLADIGQIARDFDSKKTNPKAMAEFFAGKKPWQDRIERVYVSPQRGEGMSRCKGIVDSFDYDA